MMGKYRHESTTEEEKLKEGIRRGTEVKNWTGNKGEELQEGKLTGRSKQQEGKKGNNEKGRQALGKEGQKAG